VAGVRTLNCSQESGGPAIINRFHINNVLKDYCLTTVI
jgi:hypothetical protein